jgi:hypothetical protein
MKEAKKRLHISGGQHYIFMPDVTFPIFKDPSSSTGCNIVFQDDETTIIQSINGKWKYKIDAEKKKILDATITWFLFPKEAEKMMKGALKYGKN